MTSPAKGGARPEAAISKPKRGTLLIEREPSIQKVNRELEARINTAATLNFIFSIALLANVGWGVWTITRPHLPAPVLVQYYSAAGIMIPIDPVGAGHLAAVRAALVPAPAPPPEVGAAPGVTPAAGDPAQAPGEAPADLAQPSGTAQVPAPLSPAN